MKILNFKLKILLCAFACCFFFAHTSDAATLVRPPNNLGLVGYWPLDEGTGSVANDRSGSGNKGTLTNFALSGATSNWTSGGKRGKALIFDGSNDYVTLQKSAVNFPVTISGIFKISGSVAGSQAIISHSSGTNDGYRVGQTGGILNFILGGIAAYDFSSLPTIQSGVWYFFTVTVSGNGGSVTAYLAPFGSNLSTQTIAIGTMSGTPTQVDFGHRGDTVDPFSGSMDDIRLYNRALTAAQVAALYQSGQTTRKLVSNQGLVGYWSLNEGRGNIYNDSSGNRNTGTSTTTTAPTWVTGKRGGAVQFDGVNDYVDMGRITALSGATQATLSGWVYKANASDSIGFGQYFTPYRFAMVWANDGRVYSEAENGGSGSYPNFSAPGIGWHHYVMIYDGSLALANRVIVYWDGLLKTLTPAGDSLPTSLASAANQPSFRLGMDNSEGNRYWKGIVDDVRVYNRALSATEAVALYQQNETRINSSQNSELTNGLVGLWSFNGADYDASSLNAEILDRSGSGNHADLPFAYSTGPKLTIGKVGQGLKFDGVDDYVVAPDTASLDFGTGSFSVSAWINSTATTQQRIVNKWQAPGWIFDINTGWAGTLRFRVVAPGDLDYATAAGITTNKWQFVSAVIDKSTNLLKLYVDGVQVGTSQDISSVGSVDSTASLGIGVIPGTPGLYFKGMMDEVRLYNRALSAAEVKMLYNLGK